MIGNFSELQHLASYISRHNAMAYGSTAESLEGSINFASMFSTGENYVMNKVKRGVKYLGDILSGGIGMHVIHTISLYHHWGTALLLQ